ncbi:WPP domain-interacting protein 2 [Oryza glaberrima]|uniref:WPP domain-containing protein n=2 Tax=Oryza TaxID=4527 RepID=A0A0E0QSV3_ORYRU|nr:WPP domain-interacting protein 2 [Oryza glaberrima]
MDSGGNSVNSAVESVAESPAPASPASNPTAPAAVTKGRGLRRWRRIPREHHEEGSPGSGGGGGGGSVAAAAADEDLAQLHKRRHPLGADAPKGKEEAAAAAAAVEEVGSESPVASVESSFAPQEAPPSPPVQTKLDPDLGFLIASAGFSVGAGGADSDNSDDRASKSSTNAAAPRHDFSFGGGFGRERDRPRSRAPGAAAHAKGIRTARTRGAHGARAATPTPSIVEPENSRSSVESNLRSSAAAHARQSSAGISSNGVHKVLYDDDDDDDDDAEQSDGEPPSEEAARSGAGGFYRENGSVVGRLVKGSSDSDADDHGYDERSIGKGENGEIHSGLDPYVQSIAMLRSAEEAIENEIQKFIEMRNETCENSANNHSETEWSSSCHFDESTEELSEKLKLLESRLNEASTLINDKDSEILELDVLNHKQPKQHVLCNTELLSLQSDMDQLFLEKMEAETQCFILTRASQAWNPLTEDQAAIFDIQKSLPEDHKQLEAKLRHTENRALMLEEMVEKLEAQCKDLARTSEILKLQARASRASLFCSVQFVLLFIAVGTFLVRLWPSSSEFVPT